MFSFFYFSFSGGRLSYLRRGFALLFFMCLLGSNLHAQNKLVDSLVVELAKANTDTMKVLLHCKLSEQYIMSDLEKALDHGQKAERLAASKSYQPGRARALNVLGITHFIMSEYEQALKNHLEALKLREEIKDTAGIVSSYINLGNVYFKMHDQGRAIQNYLIASEFAVKINDKLGLSKIYNNIGSYHENKGDYTEALGYFTKAAKLKEELGDKRGWSVSLVHIGYIHKQLGQPKQALTYMFKARQLEDEIHNTVSKIATLRSIVEVYQDMGQHQEALKYAKESYDMALETKSSNEIVVSSDLLRNVYEALGNYKLAYKYFAILREHELKLEKELRKEVSAEMTAKFETEKKELEIENLKAEQEKQALTINYKNTTLLISLLATFLMLVLLVLLYRSRKNIKLAHKQLWEYNQQVQVQNLQIRQQKEEVMAKSALLQQQNRELEKHTEFQSKILSIISHDLRSPFASVKGILALSQRKVMTEAQVKHLFDMLSKEMDVAGNMLNNLLVWAKSQLQGAEVQLEPLYLRQLCEENINLAKRLASEKEISLINTVAEDAYAIADKERLNFVLRNLLMNAIKFTYKGGEVRLSTKVSEKEITIMVADNGKGIAAENIPRLFTEDRFTTLGTSREKGTGLGLALCKDFVESLQGTIKVDSQEGKGSTFYVTLSRTEANKEPKEAEKLFSIDSFSVN